MHNPQEDEPVGEYEEQDRAMNTQIDKLDEILQKVLLVWKQDYPQPDGDNGLLMDEYFERLENAKTEAKTEILKHYISRDEVMGLIGEDVDYDTTDTEPYWSMENNEGANQLRAELRQALTTNEEE